MNYDKLGFIEKYNEVMYDERSVIEKFLKDQYDIRYGRQRDTWHFEPAVELVGTHGMLWDVRDIRLDKDRFVVFSVDTGDRLEDWECFNFAYGELGKIIEALPDANQILIKNAVSDIASLCRECSVNLEENPFKSFINGLGVSIYSVNYEDGHIKAYTYTGKDVMDETNTGLVLGLRNHINIEILHRSNEYKELMEFLSLEPNLRKEFSDDEKTKFGQVMFELDGTNLMFEATEIQRDSDGGLTIYGFDRDCVNDYIVITEKDIHVEYLKIILEWFKKSVHHDIMDTYNAHNAELVRKINAAWRDDKYHDKFEGILHALLERDYVEYCDKFEVPEVTTSDYAMNHAHEIMEGVCDDWDLECILAFVRYKEE